MKSNRFAEKEIPYQSLNQFALSREMIENLPMHVLDEILSGRHSPVLPMRVTDENGQTLETRSRFSLVRLESGNVDVIFYPVLKPSPLGQYSTKQQKLLAEGKAILADVELTDGKQSKAFVQIDSETNQVISAPTPVISRNLQVIAKELRLGPTEVKLLQHGEPLTFVIEDEPITVGIDLNDHTGVRMMQGDSQKWKEQSKKDWDKYTFGLYGCWVMDDDGNLDYVPEENYTEELWNEQQKSGQRNAASYHK